MVAKGANGMRWEWGVFVLDKEIKMFVYKWK